MNMFSPSSRWSSWDSIFFHWWLDVTVALPLECINAAIFVQWCQFELCSSSACESCSILTNFQEAWHGSFDISHWLYFWQLSSLHSYEFTLQKQVAGVRFLSVSLGWGEENELHENGGPKPSESQPSQLPVALKETSRVESSSSSTQHARVSVSHAIHGWTITVILPEKALFKHLRDALAKHFLKDCRKCFGRLCWKGCCSFPCRQICRTVPHFLGSWCIKKAGWAMNWQKLWHKSIGLPVAWLFSDIFRSFAGPVSCLQVVCIGPTKTRMPWGLSRRSYSLASMGMRQKMV